MLERAFHNDSSHKVHKRDGHDRDEEGEIHHQPRALSDQREVDVRDGIHGDKLRQRQHGDSQGGELGLQDGFGDWVLLKPRIVRNQFHAQYAKHVEDKNKESERGHHGVAAIHEAVDQPPHGADLLDHSEGPDQTDQAHGTQHHDLLICSLLTERNDHLLNVGGPHQGEVEDEPWITKCGPLQRDEPDGAFQGVHDQKEDLHLSSPAHWAALERKLALHAKNNGVGNDD
mmetsp:Transcript_27863/g.64724  ORF Transcript_27863/g.64724 Transcript_27863/m.64724 type:complete len:229 (+) Transcript_27863:477-1163(+)